MIPDYLAQGEPARLFPVLATTSKECRSTSVLLACMAHVDELGRELLSSVGQRVGKRSKISNFTEVVFKGPATSNKERPDGLILVKTGSKVWRALVEAKVGNSQLRVDQVERYRAMAKAHHIDCVITISKSVCDQAPEPPH